MKDARGFVGVSIDGALRSAAGRGGRDHRPDLRAESRRSVSTTPSASVPRRIHARSRLGHGPRPASLPIVRRHVVVLTRSRSDRASDGTSRRDSPSSRAPRCVFAPRRLQRAQDLLRRARPPPATAPAAAVAVAARRHGRRPRTGAAAGARAGSRCPCATTMRALDHVGELAHVARPRIAHEGSSSTCGRHAGDRCARASRCRCSMKWPHQRLDVLGPLAQRRRGGSRRRSAGSRGRRGRCPAATIVGEVAVGRRDHADVDVGSARASRRA